MAKVMPLEVDLETIRSKNESQQVQVDRAGIQAARSDRSHRPARIVGNHRGDFRLEFADDRHGSERRTTCRPPLSPSNFGDSARCAYSRAHGRRSSPGTRFSAFCLLRSSESSELVAACGARVSASGCKRPVSTATSTSLRKPVRLPFWHREYPSVKSWLESLQKPVGIMACNDIRGRQVIEACALGAMHVPNDVAVVGVDEDSLLSELSNPPLSSIALNGEQGRLSGRGIAAPNDVGRSEGAAVHPGRSSLGDSAPFDRRHRDRGPGRGRDGALHPRERPPADPDHWTS